MNYIGNEPAPDGLILVGDTNPIGAINYFHAPPDGSWLRLNGQIVAKASYPDLWTLAQGFLTADQVANPGLYRNVDANTFAVPKLDGLFLRSVGGLAAALGVKQGFATGKPTTATQTAFVSYGVGGGTFAFTPVGGANEDTKLWDAETRPDNVALVPCVKALRTTLMPSSIGVATKADQIAGIANDKFVSPAVQQNHKSAAKAWVNFTGVGVVTIRDSYGVASVTDVNVGAYIANWSVPFPNTNYFAIIGGGMNAGRMFYCLTAQAAGTVSVATMGITATGSPTVSNSNDGDFINVAAFYSG